MKAAAATPAALLEIPGISESMANQIVVAWKYAAAYGLRNAALASMAFGVVGIILALLCEDIEFVFPALSGWGVLC